MLYLSGPLAENDHQDVTRLDTWLLVWKLHTSSCAGSRAALSSTDIKDVVINPSPAKKDAISAVCLALLL